MITKNHKKSPLSSAQVVALNSLVSGATIQEAAKAAGVSRETVSRWKNRDAHFLAELNKRQKSIWEGHKMKLLGVVSAAIETIEKAVRNNPAIAMKILEKCQGLDVIPAPCGPTSVADVLHERAQKLAHEELKAMRRRENTGQLIFPDPIADIEELSPVFQKHFLALKREHGLQ